MTTDEYQGSPNFETWTINNHLTQDQETYLKLENLVLSTGNKNDLTDLLKEWTESDNPLAEEATTYSTLLQHAIDRVNWRHLAIRYWEVFKENTPETF